MYLLNQVYNILMFPFSISFTKNLTAGQSEGTGSKNIECISHTVVYVNVTPAPMDLTYP